MENYKADPPPQKNWFKIIAIRVLFAPLLVWDFFKWFFNYLGGAAIGGLVLLAQQDNKKSPIQDYEIQDESLLDIGKEELLDTLRLQSKKSEEPGYYVLNFVSPGTKYQDQLETIAHEKHYANPQLICFNYRYCAGLPKTAQTEIAINDGLAQLKYLTETRKIPMSQIVFRGFGIDGNAIALAVHDKVKAPEKKSEHGTKDYDQRILTILGELSEKPVGLFIGIQDPSALRLAIQFVPDIKAAHDSSVKYVEKLGLAPYSKNELHSIFNAGNMSSEAVRVAMGLIKQYKEKNKLSSPLHRIHLIDSQEDETGTAMKVAKALYKEDPALALNVFSPLTVETHDGCKLETIEVQTPAQFDLPEADKTYVVKFEGNGGCYQSDNNLMQLSQEATDLQANIVTFNYPGVQGSTGPARSKDQLVAAGIAQIERLVRKGADPNKIVVHGLSLGGGVGSLVVAKLHKRGIPVKLFNDRSFSNLTNVVVSWIRALSFMELFRGLREKPSDDDQTFGIILGYILKPIIKLVLVLTGWEIEAAEAYKSIPETHKEYMFGRTPKKCLNQPEHFHYYSEKPTNPAMYKLPANSYVITKEKSNDAESWKIYYVYEDGFSKDIKPINLQSAFPHLSILEKMRARNLMNACQNKTADEFLPEQKREMEMLLKQVHHHQFFSIDDRVIRQYSDMHNALWTDRKLKKMQMQVGCALGFETPQNLTAFKEKNRARKMYVKQAPWARCAHSQLTNKLVNSEGQTGAEFFKKFVRPGKDKSETKLPPAAPASNPPKTATIQPTPTS